MAMSRFAKPPSEEDLNKIVDAAIPQNTKYSTKFGMNVFNDENIIIEIRQYSERYEGGKVLGKYEQSAREFLFPGPSFTPKNEAQREILLNRTPNFTSSRGLNPKLEFSTTTTIKETQISSGYHDFIKSVKSTPPRSTTKTRKSPRRNSPQILDSSTSETEEEIVIMSPRRKSKRVYKSSVSHCVCECPRRPENHGRVVLRSRSISPNGKSGNGLGRPPFKVGKAPKNLISKRDFPSPSSKPRQKVTFGEGDPEPCPNCLIPHPDCTICTAYEKVYGSSFLKYRFLGNRTRRRPSTAPPMPSVGPRNKRSPTIPRARARIPVDSPVDDDNGDGYSRLLQTAPVGKSKSHSRIFSRRSRSSTSPEGNQRKSSREVHQRVKDLLKKNDSVLQYDPSDSNSDNESFTSLDDLRFSLDEPPVRTSSSRDLPNRSVVVPLGEDKYWSARASKYTGRSHRQVFNDSLGTIYRDLYEQALESDE